MMTLRHFLWSALALAFVPACGSGVDTSSCAPACNHAVDTCGEKPVGSLDACISVCEQDIERQAQTATCADQYIAYIGCFTTASLTCDTTELLPIGPAAASCDSALQAFLSSCVFPGGE